ncbi:hypothetical protein [Cystobacter fuscus]|uniref:hypothetical protein n=1 Tax=Cystobacter fuscus TaxID=43 RepID=UPI0012DD87CE|nr:hypothetical protein [Cystobacter fuscus]
MKTAALILGASLFFVSNSAHAAGWSSEVKIKAIETNDTGIGMRIFLTFTTPPSTGGPCLNMSQYRLGGSADNIKQMSTFAVSALLASRPVKVLLSDACDGGTYPIIVGLELR